MAILKIRWTWRPLINTFYPKQEWGSFHKGFLRNILFLDPHIPLVVEFLLHCNCPESKPRLSMMSLPKRGQETHADFLAGSWRTAIDFFSSLPLGVFLKNIFDTKLKKAKNRFNMVENLPSLRTVSPQIYHYQITMPWKVSFSQDITRASLSTKKNRIFLDRQFF